MNRQPMLAQLCRAHPFGCSDLAWQAGVSEDVVVRRVLNAPVHRAEAERVRARALIALPDGCPFGEAVGASAGARVSGWMPTIVAAAGWMDHQRKSDSGVAQQKKEEAMNDAEMTVRRDGPAPQSPVVLVVGGTPGLDDLLVCVASRAGYASARLAPEHLGSATSFTAPPLSILLLSLEAYRLAAHLTLDALGEAITPLAQCVPLILLTTQYHLSAGLRAVPGVIAVIAQPFHVVQVDQAIQAAARAARVVQRRPVSAPVVTLRANAPIPSATCVALLGVPTWSEEKIPPFAQVGPSHRNQEAARTQMSKEDDQCSPMTHQNAPLPFAFRVSPASNAASLRPTVVSISVGGNQQPSHFPRAPAASACPRRRAWIWW